MLNGSMVKKTSKSSRRTHSLNEFCGEESRRLLAQETVSGSEEKTQAQFSEVVSLDEECSLAKTTTVLEESEFKSSYEDSSLVKTSPISVDTEFNSCVPSGEEEPVLVCVEKSTRRDASQRTLSSMPKVGSVAARNMVRQKLNEHIAANCPGIHRRKVEARQERKAAAKRAWKTSDRNRRRLLYDARDRDHFEDYHVSSRRHHAPRGGVSEHPRKEANRKRRAERQQALRLNLAERAIENQYNAAWRVHDKYMSENPDASIRDFCEAYPYFEIFFVGDVLDSYSSDYVDPADYYSEVRWDEESLDCKSLSTESDVDEDSSGWSVSPIRDIEPTGWQSLPGSPGYEPLRDISSLCTPEFLFGLSQDAYFRRVRSFTEIAYGVENAMLMLDPTSTRQRARDELFDDRELIDMLYLLHDHLEYYYEPPNFSTECDVVDLSVEADIYIDALKKQRERLGPVIDSSEDEDVKQLVDNLDNPHHLSIREHIFELYAAYGCIPEGFYKIPGYLRAIQSFYGSTDNSPKHAYEWEYLHSKPYVSSDSELSDLEWQEIKEAYLSDYRWEEEIEEFKDTPVDAPKSWEDYVEYVKCYLKQIFGSTPLTSHVIQWTTSICNFIYQLYRCRSFADYMSAAIAFATSIGVFVDVVYNAAYRFAEICTYAFKSVITESAHAGFGFLEKFYTKIMTSEFIIRLRDFVLAVVSKHIFDMDVSPRLRDLLGRPKKMTLFESLGEIYQGFKYFVIFGEALYNGQPLSEVLMAEDQISAYIRNADDIIRTEDLTYNGLPIEGFTDLHVYYQRVLSALADYEVIKTYITKLDNRYKKCKDLDVVIRAIRARVYGKMKGVRNTPIGIVLVGPPSIGKSHFVQMVCATYSEVRGREHKDSYMYSRMLSSDFWEGYTNQPYIFYSELGNKSKQLAKVQGDEILLELQTLIDKLPFMPNMAFEDKGKIFADPEMIIVDTNNKFMNCDVIFSEPSAFLRRWLFVNIRVKPEFVGEGGVIIDEAKSLSAGGNLMDRYDIRCEKFEPTHNHSVQKCHELFNGGIYGFKQFLVENFRNHILRSDEIKAKMDYTLRDMEIKTESGVETPFSFSSLLEAIRESDVINQIDARISYFADFLIVFAMYFITTMYLAYIRVVPLDWSGRLKFTMMFAFIFCLITLIFVPYASFVIGTFFVLAIGITAGMHWSELIDAVNVKSKAKLAYLAHSNAYNVYHNYTWYKYGALMVSVASLFVGYKVVSWWMQTHKDTEAKVSNFFKQSEVSEQINEVEDKMEIYPARERVKSKYENVWNDMNLSALTNIKSTQSASQLYKSISSNVRFAEIEVLGKSVKTHILGVSGTYALINAHSLLGATSADIYIARTGGMGDFDPNNTRHVKISLENSVRGPDDLILFDTGQLHFKSLVKHFIESMPEVHAIAGCIAGYRTRLFPSCNMTLNDNYIGPFKLPLGWSYKFPEHAKGHCGLPVLLEHNGKSAIVGIHVGGDDNTEYGFANCVLRDTLVSLIDQLDAVNPYMSINSRGIVPECILEEPVPKSPFRFENFHCIEYHGKMPGRVLMNRKSSFVVAPGFLKISAALERVGIHQTKKFLPPVFKPGIRDGVYISPYNNWLRKANRGSPPLNPGVMRRAIDVYLDHIMSGLRDSGIDFVTPITMEDAINGIEHDDYTRRINVTTSGGMYYPGKKGDYLPKVFDEIREPTEALKQDCLRILNAYTSGETASPIFSLQNKDEMRKVEKVIAGDVRQFAMTPLPFLIISRMFLSPIYTLMVECGAAFCTAVGVNMHLGADQLIRKLLEFSHLLMEGDYEGYDVGTPVDIARASATLIYELAKRLGYNEYALSIVRGLLSDGIFPLLCMNQDVFSRPGFQTSGKYATAEDNSVKGVLYLLYVWYSLDELAHLNFFDFVLPLVYGDDIIASVKPVVAPLFNNISYALCCREFFGVNFTSAAKDGNMELFVSVDKISFLKRTFVMFEEEKVYVAPLDGNSIHRALRWYAPSKHISAEDQRVASFTSELYEIFFHVRQDGFNDVRSVLLEVLSDTFGGDIEEYNALLPTYHLIYSRIFPVCVDGTGTTESMCFEGELLSSELHLPALKGPRGSTPGCAMSRVHDQYQWFSRSNNVTRLLDMRDKYGRELANLEREISETKMSDLPLSALANSSRIYENMPLYRANLHRKKLLCKKADLEVSLEFVNRQLGANMVFRSESDVVGESDLDTDVSGLVKKTETLTDIVGDKVSVRVGPDTNNVAVGQVPNFPLNNFFDRPMEIASGTIALAGALSAEYNLSDILSKNVTFRSKVKNFAHCRWRYIHVRVILSGSPFHTGRILFSVQYHPDKNRNLRSHALNLAANANYRPILLNYLSQSPIAVVMDVRSNKPAEFKIPFVSPKPALRLYNTSSSAIAAATSFEDFADMVSLFAYTINTIGSVSAGTASPVGYNIYAWIEGCEVSIPTATQLAISTESFVTSSSRDEQKTGPVEKISSALVDLAEVACTIPGLQEYAIPAAIVLKGVNSLASHFGLSRPSTEELPSFVKNRPYSGGSICIGSETVEKLSYDPKRELAIDGHNVGSTIDDMSIFSIASRESYIETFTWAEDDAAMAVIKTLAVHPQLCTFFSDGGATPCEMVQPSAMAFAVAPFKYWRGEIHYRLDFVTSAFHRGKFAVMFEPNHFHAALIESNVALNKNNLIFVDIANTNSVEFSVNWASTYPWLGTVGPESVEALQNVDTIISNDSSKVNGYLILFPVTRLQSPDGSDVEINLFVKADSMLVQQMTDDLPTSRVLITPESLVSDLSDEKGVVLTLNPTSATFDNITSYYFGEQPTSFRACLKRYISLPVVTHSPGGSHTAVKVVRTTIPAPVPAYADEDVVPYLLGYLRYAFVGLRGSMRYRYRMLEYDPRKVQCSTVVALGEPALAPTQGSSSVSVYNQLFQRGSINFLPNTNGGIEYEVPFYSMNGFVFSFADDLMGPSVVDGEMSTVWSKSHEVYTEHDGIASHTTYHFFDIAIGEDFSLLNFNGAPYYTYAAA